VRGPNTSPGKRFFLLVLGPRRSSKQHSFRAEEICRARALAPMIRIGSLDERVSVAYIIG